MSEESNFHWLDYVLFTASLLFSLGVGIYHGYFGGGQKSTKEYLLGNKKMAAFPVAVSLLMSSISAISILGTPAEYYLYGTQVFMASIAGIVSGILSAYLFIPMVYPLGIVSFFQYHEKRFHSRFLRRLASLVSITYLTLYLGIVSYAPSTALEAVTGFPLWASILCTAGLGTIYTAIGGMKAVIWTDFFQGIVMYTGLIAVVIMGAIEVGGLSAVFAISEEHGRIDFFNMDPDPTVRQSFWTVTVASFILGLSGTVGSQTTVQRYMSTKSVKDAMLVIIWNICLGIIVDVLLMMVGLTLFAYYQYTGCDPYRGKLIGSSNQLLPYFVVDVLGVPGFPGLFIAVLFSGALSSISSSLSSIAALTWKDFLEPIFPNTTENIKTLINKLTVFIVGVISLASAFLISTLQSGLYSIALSILGGFTGPLSAMAMLGAIFPCVQWRGATIGLLCGVGMTLWMNTGYYSTVPHRSYLNTTVENCTFAGNETAREIPDDLEDVFWLYSLSFWYIGLAGWLTTIITGLLFSFLTVYQKPSEVDSNLLIPLPDRLCCCLSHRVCDCCYCGVDYYNNYDMEEEFDQIKDVTDETMERTKDKGVTNKGTDNLSFISKGDVISKNIMDKGKYNVNTEVYRTEKL